MFFKTLLDILRLPWLQVFQLLTIIILITALDKPRKFLKNLIKIGRGVQDADPRKILDAVIDEIEEERC